MVDGSDPGRWAVRDPGPAHRDWSAGMTELSDAARIEAIKDALRMTEDRDWVDTLADIERIVYGAAIASLSPGTGLDVAVQRAVREAFEKTMYHVEPWASGPVVAKHTGMFLTDLAA